jgi:hypothetical protein
VTKLTISREKKMIEVEVMLEGEAAPVAATVKDYTFEMNPDGTGVLTVGDVQVSKPWMEVIAKNAVVGRPVRIPAEYAKWAKMVL